MVLAGKASLRDLQEWHDLSDLADLHELIEFEAKIKAKPPRP